jgi:hypothetical protein
MYPSATVPETPALGAGAEDDELPLLDEVIATATPAAPINPRPTRTDEGISLEDVAFELAALELTASVATIED